MATRVLDLLAALEARLEQTKTELATLREENDALRQQLSAQRQQCLPPSPPTTPLPPQTLAQELSQERPKEQEPSRQPPEALHEPEPLVDKATTIGGTPQPPSPHALLNQWYERYPRAFFTGHTKPLKVGIHQDLAQREPWSGKLIRRTLANYVNLPRYVKSMREGAERIDLDGNPAGSVDKEAARHAGERRKQSHGKNTQNLRTRPSKQQPPLPAKPVDKVAAAPESAPSQRHHDGIDGKEGTQKTPSLEDKLKGLQQKFTAR